MATEHFSITTQFPPAISKGDGMTPTKLASVPCKSSRIRFYRAGEMQPKTTIFFKLNIYSQQNQYCKPGVFATRRKVGKLHLAKCNKSRLLPYSKSIVCCPDNKTTRNTSSRSVRLVSQPTASPATAKTAPNYAHLGGAVWRKRGPRQSPPLIQGF